MPSEFRPNIKPKKIDAEYPERLRRMIRAYNEVHQKYIPNRKEDKAELELSVYKKKYPDNLERRLLSLIRVKVPRGQFELDDSGTIDEKEAVPEALVYTIQEQVTNPKPDDELSLVLAHCNTKMGYYEKPSAFIKKDDLDNPVGSKIHSHKTMFYIPFSEANAKKILEEFNYEFKKLLLAVAMPGASDPWYGRETYTVYNLDEWLHSNFEDSLNANKGGFLKDKTTGRVVTEGGVSKYIMHKVAKREQAEKEFKEFKEKQRTRTKGK